MLVLREEKSEVGRENEITRNELTTKETSWKLTVYLLFSQSEADITERTEQFFIPRISPSEYTCRFLEHRRYFSIL